MAQRRLSKRGAILIGLCVAALSTFSVLFRVRIVNSGGGGGGGASVSSHLDVSGQATARDHDWAVGATGGGATGGAGGVLNASMPLELRAEPKKLFGAEGEAAVPGGAPVADEPLEEVEHLEETETLEEAEFLEQAEHLEEAGVGVKQDSPQKPNGSSDQRLESGLEGGGKIKWPAMLPNTGRSEGVS